MDKVIIDGIYPQTNYTTQQFYTKEEYDKLQAENERLKSALAIWENATLKQTALKVVEVDKYRQALQEIRDIADIIANANCYPAKEAQKILAKINEVIGVE